MRNQGHPTNLGEMVYSTRVRFGRFGTIETARKGAFRVQGDGHDGQL